MNNSTSEGIQIQQRYTRISKGCEQFMFTRTISVLHVVSMCNMFQM